MPPVKHYTVYHVYRVTRRSTRQGRKGVKCERQSFHDGFVWEKDLDAFLDALPDGRYLCHPSFKVEGDDMDDPRTWWSRQKPFVVKVKGGAWEEQ